MAATKAIVINRFLCMTLPVKSELFLVNGRKDLDLDHEILPG